MLVSSAIHTSSEIPHRNPQYCQGLVDRFSTGERTLYESFQRGVSISGNQPCLGTRITNSKEEKFRWITYNEVNKRLHNIGYGIMNMDLAPEVQGTSTTGPLRMIVLFLKNRPEWVICEQACYSQSIATIPMYDTLGPDTVEMVLNETECATAVCTSSEISRLIEAKNHCPYFKNIILVGEYDKSVVDSATVVGVRVIPLNQVEQSGSQQQRSPQPPSPENVATFCYTSGTTGKAKGAVLTHGNLVATAAAAMFVIKLTNSDRHLSYLPLAHVFERAVEVTCYYAGARVGFYQGDTLKIPEDISALKPTIFPSVPRLLNRMYDKIMQGVRQAGGTKARLFQQAYDAKLQGLKEGKSTHLLWDQVVFKKLAKRVGLHHCRLMITGSAPIASHILEFLRIVFCPVVLEGYGQTETGAAATVTRVDDLTTGHVGVPLPCNEVKLMSVDELGYNIRDTIHSSSSGREGIPCRGRGEICVRGPNRFLGYYKMEEATAETVDSQGWVHTGDIGMWTLSGNLAIIDRKKNIFKLAQGEYIAPEKIEAIYCKSSFVAQAFVHGDSLQHQLVAIIVPDAEVLTKWASENALNGTLQELCENDKVVSMIHKDLDTIRKEAKLLGFEHAAAIKLEYQPFTLENGLLTPTFKLKRDVARQRYQQDITIMYSKLASQPPRT